MSQFGGIPVQPSAQPAASGSRFGGVPVGAPGANAPASAKSESDDFISWLADQGSFLGKRALNAAASLPGVPGTLVGAAARNLPSAATDYLPGIGPIVAAERLRQAAQGKDSITPLSAENIRAAMADYSGGASVPRAPRNTAERYGGAVADFLGASAVPAGLVASAATSPLRVIAGETAASVGGGVGSEVARDMAPDNPYAPIVGGVIGSLTPGGIVSATRGAIRGGSEGAKQAAEALQNFEKIGTTPTLSQATTGGYWPGRYVARLLEFTPGGVLPAYQRWKSQLEAAANTIDAALVKATGGRGTSEQLAGQNLQAGAQRFASKVSSTAAGLEARLEKAVPETTVVHPTNTLNTLEDLTDIGTVQPQPSALGAAPARANSPVPQPVKGQALGSSPLGQTSNISQGAFNRIAGNAPPTPPTGGAGAVSEVGQATISPTIQKALQAFKSDVEKNGGVSFRALKAFRTQLGAKTSGGQPLIGDVSSGQADQLYKALTKDMEAAAQANGAGNLVKLRNSYYSQRKGQIEDTFDPLVKRASTDEDAYRRFINAPASQQSMVMRQLAPAQRRMVAGRKLYELGLPTPGQATGDTERFSYDTFDTNFEKLARKGATVGGTGARDTSSLDALFSMSGTHDLKQALTDLSKAAESYKAAEKFLRNPSQSAYVGAQYAGGVAVGSQIAAMNPVGALMTAGLVYGVPYALVRGGNSATFIRLIADTGRQTVQTLPGHIARLAKFAAANPEYAPVIKQIVESAAGGQSADQSQPMTRRTQP